MENKPQKYIDFIITQKCTYNCEYCSQSKQYNAYKHDADNKTINAFYDFLKTLDTHTECHV